MITIGSNVNSVDLKQKLENYQLKYWHVLGFGFGILGISYLLVLLIDVLNILGLRGLLGGIIPFFWNTLFAERRFIELTQWTLITGLITTSYYIYKELLNQEKFIDAKFWLIITFTAGLMLFEDALNPRHFLFRNVLELHWKQINIAETIYYGILAGIPAYGFLRYGKKVREQRRALVLLIIGGLFYGAAVLISGPGHSFGVTVLGEKGLEATVAIGGEELQEAYNLAEQRIIEVHGNDYDDLAFMFTDHFIEESLELIGATFLLGSAVSYLESLRKRNDKN